MDGDAVVAPQSVDASNTQSVKLHVENAPAPHAFEEVAIGWENVTKHISVDAKKGKKGNKEMRCILRGLSGQVLPGEIMAIMGPSGSGKTSLLNCLAGRSFLGVEGKITLNGVPFHKSFKRILGYVMQEDLFFDHLTVREQIEYTALLRLPGTKKAIREKCEALIKRLGLGKCCGTRSTVRS